MAGPLLTPTTDGTKLDLAVPGAPLAPLAPRLAVLALLLLLSDRNTVPSPPCVAPLNNFVRLKSVVVLVVVDISVVAGRPGCLFLKDDDNDNDNGRSSSELSESSNSPSCFLSTVVRTRGGGGQGMKKIWKNAELGNRGVGGIGDGEGDGRRPKARGGGGEGGKGMKISRDAELGG